MLSHGVISAALFLIVGVVYDRLHTRMISRYGGIVETMPRYAIIFMLFMMASVGLPGTAGFVGEFMTLFGAFQSNMWIGIFAASGIVLGATYMLLLYRRVVFGKLEKDDLKAMLDMTPREIFIFAPLVILVLWMGIYPMPFLDIMSASVDALLVPFVEADAAGVATSN